MHTVYTDLVLNLKKVFEVKFSTYAYIMQDGRKYILFYVISSKNMHTYTKIYYMHVCIYVYDSNIRLQMFYDCEKILHFYAKFCNKQQGEDIRITVYMV